jgi:hypothetical protein
MEIMNWSITMNVLEIDQHTNKFSGQMENHGFRMIVGSFR